MSPYSLLQEQLRDDEWKVLIACVMLNLTTVIQVKRVIWKFFSMYPDPESCVRGDPDDIRELIRPLGMYNRRTRSLQMLSQSFVDGEYKSVRDLPGVGKYAADSHRMFCEGYLVENVQDEKLKAYLSWAKQHVDTKRIQETL